MKGDLISRKAVIEGINELMESPYANSPQFGRERKECMELVKALCVNSLPTALDINRTVDYLKGEAIKYDKKDCRGDAIESAYYKGLSLGYHFAADDILNVLSSNIEREEKRK